MWYKTDTFWHDHIYIIFNGDNSRRCVIFGCSNPVVTLSCFDVVRDVSFAEGALWRLERVALYLHYDTLSYQVVILSCQYANHVWQNNVVLLALGVFFFDIRMCCDTSINGTFRDIGRYRSLLEATVAYYCRLPYGTVGYFRLLQATVDSKRVVRIRVVRYRSAWFGVVMRHGGWADVLWCSVVRYRTAYDNIL